MDDEAQLQAVVKALQGQLTATVHAEADDGPLAASLLPLLCEKAGRVLFNGYPTGVEVCDAMVHGGPWPATTDARGTSVGSRAIERFLRPVCLQNAPAALLPPALQDMTIHTTHNSQTRVAESGKFKKQLTLTDLTFIGLGAIFGSGWLFAASHVASIAGPAGIASWVIGGFAVLLLGIVYCELGAALPRAGGIIRYPVFSHGELMGYLLGFIT
ncbi:MAG: amino acid permease, partial [Klebsiella sp.]|nr:amino acid permease [Klebsiella sp.]